MSEEIVEVKEVLENEETVGIKQGGGGLRGGSEGQGQGCGIQGMCRGQRGCFIGQGLNSRGHLGGCGGGGGGGCWG